jgi:DnaJ-class molecular chaperone
MDIGSSDDHYTPVTLARSAFSFCSSALLGIDAEADRAELRRAWRRLALRWHPDRAGPGATATF